jgi:hypothetical protein
MERMSIATPLESKSLPQVKPVRNVFDVMASPSACHVMSQQNSIYPDVRIVVMYGYPTWLCGDDILNELQCRYSTA